MPIINPIYFYFLDVIDKLLPILIIATSALWCVHLIGMFVCHIEREIDKFKMFKKFLIPCIIMTLLTIATPSKGAVISMMIANQITIERVEDTKSTVEKVYNDIIKLMEGKK